MAVVTASPDVSLLYRRWSNHAGWSGYPRYVEYLGGMVRARRVPPTLLPQFLLWGMEKGLRRPAPARERIGLDLSAARRLLIGCGEVVHLLYGEWDYFCSGRLRGVGHLRGNRLVLTFHQPPAGLARFRQRWLDFERIDAAVALGSQLAAYLRGVVGTARVFRASLGVDVRAWHPVARRSPTPTCVFVGSHLRDFSLLENVIRLVVREQPAVRFEVVTNAQRVESLRALPNVRARWGISDAELRSVYQRAWVHVLPLSDVVACNSLLEGMACGLPTVTTAVGDVLDYTTDRGAICVAPGDESAMADAVLGLLKDSGRRERLGRAAREVAETMSLEVVARQHADIYRKLATRGRLGTRTEHATRARAYDKGVPAGQ